MKRNFFKKFTALTLATIMVTCCGSIADTGKTSDLFTVKANAEEIFAENITVNEPAAYSDLNISYLNDAESDIYDYLLEQCTLIANGDKDTASITIPELTMEWTWEELGLATGADSETMKTAIRTKFSQDANTSKIINVLLADNPYEMYWYDKTSGCGTKYSINYTTNEYAKIYDITFIFSISQDYQLSTDTAKLDTDKTNDAEATLLKAQAVIDANASKTDYEKLVAFKQYICDNNTYNETAAAGGVAYGNPWQMIYVFDEIDTTNVVCEGYAKAFLYLCEKSGIECYLATGDCGGAHMWNIVVLDGKSYLVDITNCDGDPYTTGEVTIGYPDALFLKGMTKVNDTTYKKVINFYDNNDYTVTYVYDTGKTAMYNPSILDISSENYKAPTITADTNGTAISGMSVSLGGNIGVNFFVKYDDAVDKTTTKMKFTFNGKEKVVPFSEAVLDAATGYYKFTFGVSAKEMTDTITAQMYVGETPGTSKSCSVQDYAKKYMDSTNDVYDELVTAMLNYGAYSQIYFGYNADSSSLANSVITGADLSTTEIDSSVDKYFIDSTSLSAERTYIGSTLVLDTLIKIRHYFTFDEGVTVPTGLKKDSEGRYYYESDPIAPADLDEEHTVTIGEVTIKYSPLTYAYRMSKKSTTGEALKNLCFALYEYNKATE